MNDRTGGRNDRTGVPANHHADAARIRREVRIRAAGDWAVQTATPAAQDRLGAVLSVLVGGVSSAQEALRCGVAEADVERWRRLFIDAGRRGLLMSGRPGPQPSATGLETQNAALKSELRMKLAELLYYRHAADGQLGPFAEVEEIRRESEITISRFCVLIGVSRRTYFRRLALLTDGARPPENERDSTSVVSICAQLVEDYVAKHPGFGYRRIRELMIADGHMVSASTVHRAIQVSQRRASDPIAQAGFSTCDPRD